ncbi:MAG TPA: MarR family transcriptional regulator [Dehalococcoidia bacterium]|nr:MarR family transcriptional regulator [Dehalococcoidia bacterium]
MDEVERRTRLRQLVEDVGILFNELGLPRMAGRILGWLLVCSPPHQSATELSSALGGSKGSISSMTRLLIEVGLIERMSLPQQRITYYRIKPGAWHEIMRNRMAHLTSMRQLVQRGLELVPRQDVQLEKRLREILDFYTFFERELPLLLDRWEKQRAKAEASRNLTRVTP